MDYYDRQRRREYWLWVSIAVVLGLLLLAKFAMAAQIQAYVSWDGKDAVGNDERGQVSFELIDADTLDVYAVAVCEGPVKDLAFSVFGIQPPDNETITVRIYAVAIDAAGNRSGPSETVSFDLAGADTLAPCVPVIQLNITQ